MSSASRYGSVWRLAMRSFMTGGGFTNPLGAPLVGSSGAGTGTGYGASYVTGVTGGGAAVPGFGGVNSYSVATYGAVGDGVHDDTSAIQAACDAAASAGKIVHVPYTSAYYKITGVINVQTSIGGTGGMPTIQINSGSGTEATGIFQLATSMTGWVYNLHLKGYYAGQTAYYTQNEHAHGINIGSVSGVTISNNIIDSVVGDAISNQRGTVDGGSVDQNIIIDNNTMLRTYRNCVGLRPTHLSTKYVVTNNIFDKHDANSCGFDFEPDGGTITYVEVAYNKFAMLATDMIGGRYGADGYAWNAFANAGSTNPGGNNYLHHNYGTFGLGFPAANSPAPTGAWGTFTVLNNVEGTTPPA